MRSKNWLLVFVVALLVVGLLPAATPVHAASAAIGRLWATCGNFSVDVAISGQVDDGNGLDRFRYFVADGTGKKLYSEDASRPVGSTQGSLVVNFSYDNDGADGGPSANPIRFLVQDLDAAGNVLGVVGEASFDAACLNASGSANRSGDFRPPHFLKASFSTTTPVLQSPGGQQIGGLVIEAGKEQYAVYRTGDGNWIAVDVGGNDLVWVARSAANVDIALLGVPPTRIDLANPQVPTTQQPGITPFPTFFAPGTVIPGQVAVGQVTVRLRLRAEPSLTSPILIRIPANTVVPIFGRNAPATWIRTAYGGFVGWVSSSYVLLNNVRLLDLPVVQ
jgi:Bacterial SH3 domain